MSEALATRTRPSTRRSTRSTRGAGTNELKPVNRPSSRPRTSSRESSTRNTSTRTRPSTRGTTTRPSTRNTSTRSTSTRERVSTRDTSIRATSSTRPSSTRKTTRASTRPLKREDRRPKRWKDYLVKSVDERQDEDAWKRNFNDDYDTPRPSDVNKHLESLEGNYSRSDVMGHKREMKRAVAPINFFMGVFIAIVISVIAFGLLRGNEEPIVEDPQSKIEHSYEVVNPSTSTNTGILRGQGQDNGE